MELLWLFVVHPGKRSVGLPLARRRADLHTMAGSDWVQKATDRVLLCSLGKAGVHQWTTMGSG